MTLLRRVVEPRSRITTWSLVGDRGGVSLAGQLLPDVLGSEFVDLASGLLGFARTDAGWMMPMDLGIHRYVDDPRAGLVRMDECDVLRDERGCFYGGSLLAAWEPFEWWAQAGFDDRVFESVLRAHYSATFGELLPE